MGNDANCHRRAFFWNYRAPGTYLITLLKRPEIPRFSEITPEAQVVYQPLGRVIVAEMKALFSRHPVLQIYQYSVMPDHVHMLLRIIDPAGHHLGYYVGNFTGAVSRRWSRRGEEGEVLPVFEEGYNDSIVGPSRSLRSVFDYVRDNPRRRAVRRAHPDWFRRVNALTVGTTPCRAYGNMQLLENPFREAVAVHRADSEEERIRARGHWLYTAANGGVLVSPFISHAEKMVRAEALSLGGRLILVTDTAMSPRWKPAASDFTLCEQGRLLIISPADSTGAPLSRARCLQLNALATAIASCH